MPLQVVIVSNHFVFEICAKRFDFAWVQLRPLAARDYPGKLRIWLRRQKRRGMLMFAHLGRI